jgi:hypothetical protein
MKNRIIKFRAWDRKQLQMVYDKDRNNEWTTPENEEVYQPVTIYQNGIIFCRKGKWGKENEVIDEKGQIGYLNWEFDEHYQDCDIMQYIGIKDKYQKEIYEGDFVKRGNVIGEIRWDEIEARFRIYCDNSKPIPCNYPVDFDWEVIGNIFENPEFLND